MSRAVVSAPPLPPLPPVAVIPVMGVKREAGELVRQGEDLGRWVRSVRYGWDQLTGVQQWMCEQ
ncbi:hypothetical protein ACWF95_41640, partial [Streptomyces vinaceus]